MLMSLTQFVNEECPFNWIMFRIDHSLHCAPVDGPVARLAGFERIILLDMHVLAGYIDRCRVLE